MNDQKRPLRRFNNDGLHALSTWLEKGDASVPPVGMLDDPALSEALPGGGDIEIKIFDGKYEMGVHIKQSLGVQWEAEIDDAGLLAWLSLAFHESTMVNSSGKPYLGQASRHLVATD